MELSLFIAKLIGVMYVILGAAIIVQPKYYQKMYKDVMKSAGLLMVLGILTLFLGTLMILTHNVWVKNWTVVITVFGWIAALKGAAILLFPNEMTDFSNKMMKKVHVVRMAGIGCFVIGGLFCYAGFLGTM